MANKRFSGVLRDPVDGTPADKDRYRFTHTSTTGEVVRGSTSYIRIGEDGVYDFTLEYGNITICSYSELGRRWINQGNVTISSETSVTTLPALLLATTPATPELVLQLEQILSDAEAAAADSQASADNSQVSANDSQASADAAAQSAIDAALSGADNEELIKAILVAQGLSGSYGFFADGFSYANEGDVGISTDNKIYKYVGVGAPAKEVAAGTNPSGDADYEIVVFNSAGGISDSSGTNIQDYIDENLTPFRSASDMENATFLNGFPEYTRLSWQGRFTQSDGGSNWGVLRFGAHTADGGSVFSVDANTYVEANLKGCSVNFKKFGVFGDWKSTTDEGMDNYQGMQNCIDYCELNGITKARLGDGIHRITKGLVSNKSLTIEGNTMSFYGDWVRDTSNLGSVILADGSMTDDMITLQNDTSGSVNPNRVGGILSKVFLVGNYDVFGTEDDKGYKTNLCGSGIVIINRQNGTIEKCIAMKALNGVSGEAGVLPNTEWSFNDTQCCANWSGGLIGGIGDSKISGGRYAQNKQAGVVVGSQDFKITGGAYIDFNGTHGVAVRSINCTMSDLIVNFNGADGISCVGDSGTMVVSCNISDQSSGAGISATSSDISVSSCALARNSSGDLKKSDSSVVRWSESNSGSSFNVTNWTGFKGRRVLSRAVGATLLSPMSGGSFSLSYSGAEVGDMISVAAPSLPSSDIITTGSVTASGSVSFQVFNFSGAIQDVAGDYKIYLIT